MLYKTKILKIHDLKIEIDLKKFFNICKSFFQQKPLKIYQTTQKCIQKFHKISIFQILPKYKKSSFFPFKKFFFENFKKKKETIFLSLKTFTRKFDLNCFNEKIFCRHFPHFY